MIKQRYMVTFLFLVSHGQMARAEPVVEAIFKDGFEARVIITTVDDPQNSVGIESSIALGNDGFPVISYWDETANTLKVAKCNDIACAGGNETISNIDSGGRGSSIAVGLDGFPVISYRDADLLQVVKCNDPACAGNDETVNTLDSALGSSTSTSLAINSKGFPVIGYDDRTTNSIKIVTCNDMACAGDDETIGIADNFGGIPGDPSLALGTAGFPVISYWVQKIITVTLTVAKCNDVACTGGDETITVLDGPGNVGGYSSIAVGADGFPVISYRGPQSLKVAKCNDTACAGNNETITTVDALDDVGEFTSIAIGSDTLPVISYFDRTAGALKVAKCNDVACAGGDEGISTVDDPPTSAGFHTSIVIDNDGLPVISYWRYAADGAALKVARCLAPDCKP